MLRKVGVLILIHQHIAEALFPFSQHIGMFFKQQIGIEQDVIKVHCIALSASVTIAQKHLS